MLSVGLKVRMTWNFSNRNKQFGGGGIGLAVEWSKSCCKRRKWGRSWGVWAGGRARQRDRGKRAPEATLFVGFSGRHSPRGSWWLWGRVAPFSLLTKAERSAGRQEGSSTILHGRIVFLTDGAALGERGADGCWVCATVLQLHGKVWIQQLASLLAEPASCDRILWRVSIGIDTQSQQKYISKDTVVAASIFAALKIGLDSCFRLRLVWFRIFD